MDKGKVISEQRRTVIPKGRGSARISCNRSGRSYAMNSDKLNSYRNKIISKSVLLRCSIRIERIMMINIVMVQKKMMTMLAINFVDSTMGDNMDHYLVNPNNLIHYVNKVQDNPM